MNPWYLARLAVAGLVAASALEAGDPAKPWYFTVYLQESFPKQTNTNKQIDQINQAFGTDFETWDDVHNLNLGLQLFRQVHPNWKVGLQFDYSRGAIKGRGTVPTEAGPATLKFRQEYSTYADLYAVAHFLPCTRCETWVPFVYGGVGVAYEKDTTTLTLRNDLIDQGLKVDNDGTFPSYSAGLGLDVFPWRGNGTYLELGVAYVWARLKHNVKAEGALAPSPEVTADTDTSGPNYWLGVGWRF